MALKIENKPLTPIKHADTNLAEFVKALATLKTGQSFLSDYSNSNARFALSVAGYALGRKFKMQKEGSVNRFGRVS